MSADVAAINFADLELIEPIQRVLNDVGYETPSPIQAQIIPHMLAGEDVLGQAQTGTGKTAAFALPLLSQLDLSQRDPQVLVLAPTRELAIQVAEAFQKYATYLPGFRVLPVYGGQGFREQLQSLKRGVHVIVGTPGRVMDHMRRGTLNLGNLRCLVLDEADEMLRMGFIDDVEWVLEQIPQDSQIALFSATMPSQIRRIAQQHLNDPTEITIKVKTATADTIRQRYWLVSGLHKLDALTRLLEAEPFDGMIIFTRTKMSTEELAEKLSARGFAAAALNGDMVQQQRERTVDRLKKGQLDILVGTDVVARGLDVERISHVINYDVPHDVESYIHRIGRTGRAGREGDAILFLTPREKRMLYSIEKATRRKIEPMDMPSTQVINDQRIERFKQRITDTLGAEDGLSLYQQILADYEREQNIPALEIAAALAKLMQGDQPLLLENKPKKRQKSDFRERDERGGQERRGRERNFGDRAERPPRNKGNRKGGTPLEPGMARFRIEVGREHDVKPGNIVGAIANESGLSNKQIGQIDIHDSFSVVDLPDDLPKDAFQILKKVWVAGQKLEISRVGEGDHQPNSRPNNRPSKKPKFNKKKPAGGKPRKPRKFD